VKKILISFLISLLACLAVTAKMVQFPSQGFLVPQYYINGPGIAGSTGGLGGISAANNKLVFYGRVYQKDLWFRRGNVAKNLNHISFSSDVRTCSGCTSTVQVDIEGVSTSAGPPGQPDGSILGGGNALATQSLSSISNSVWYTGMPNFTAPAVVRYGQLIAVVFSFSTYDSGAFNLAGASQLTDGAAHSPTIVKYNGTTWTSSYQLPNIALEFDDGTVGTLAMGLAYQQVAVNNTYNSSSNPNEIGMSFQIPFNAQIDALCANFSVASASSMATIELTDFSATPTVLASVAGIDGHTARGTGGTRNSISCFPINVISLKRNTTYVVGVKATTANNITASSIQFGAASNLDTTMASGQAFTYVTRTNGASWSAISTTKRPDFAVRISAIDDGTGPGHDSVHDGVGIGP
jgi:hypothetical protein